MSITRVLQKKEAVAMRAFAAAKYGNLVPAPTRDFSGYYVPGVWHVRDGANDHLQHASLPMGAQIQVRAV